MTKSISESSLFLHHAWFSDKFFDSISLLYCMLFRTTVLMYFRIQFWPLSEIKTPGRTAELFPFAEQQTLVFFHSDALESILPYVWPCIPSLLWCHFSSSMGIWPCFIGAALLMWAENLTCLEWVSPLAWALHNYWYEMMTVQHVLNMPEFYSGRLKISFWDIICSFSLC